MDLHFGELPSLDSCSLLQVFLSKLSRPLTVPDDKVTRWHPRFPLDQVPAIKPEALPEPPDVVKFTTAADVLQHATLMGKVGSRVRGAT